MGLIDGWCGSECHGMVVSLNAFASLSHSDFPFQSPVVGLVPSGMEAQHHWSVKEQSSLCCAPVCGHVDALCIRVLPF